MPEITDRYGLFTAVKVPFCDHVRKRTVNESVLIDLGTLIIEHHSYLFYRSFSFTHFCLFKMINDDGVFVYSIELNLNLRKNSLL